MVPWGRPRIGLVVDKRKVIFVQLDDAVDHDAGGPPLLVDEGPLRIYAAVRLVGIDREVVNRVDDGELALGLEVADGLDNATVGEERLYVQL